MLGHGLPRAPRELDAIGMLVMPGGVDAHCHLDQPMPDGLKMADDSLSGTRSALCGGTTTVVSFAAQPKGQSLQAAVDDYHRRAEGRALIPRSKHERCPRNARHRGRGDRRRGVRRCATRLKRARAAGVPDAQVDPTDLPK
ncbi:hypothetical protein WS75_08985 [Burkholderia sp. FL-7-2-10-S1-D7]|nr:hypothetical protein WS75_08985 [Burkholderia sp. FL-7-2-10-S1-D7]